MTVSERVIENLSARTARMHLRCTCSHYNFRALHNDLDILATFKYYFYHF